MRALTKSCLAIVVTALVPTWVFAQGDCPIPPGGGGIVGGLNRVTRQIDGENCKDGEKTDQAPAAAKDNKDKTCKSLSFAYQPSAILFGQGRFPKLSYAPDGCTQPTGEVEYKLSAGSPEVFSLTRMGGVFVISNVSASATVRATHGALPPASADLSSVARPPKCDEMRLAYEPATIALDQSATPTITNLPENCLDAPDKELARFESDDPKIASLSSRKNGTVFGVSEGTAHITATLGKFSKQATVTVVNAGPDCKSFEAVYAPRMPLGAVSKERNGLSPSLSYRPSPCKRPPGAPEFTALTPDLISVAPASGVVTALKVGTARVGVKHHDLPATAKIEIVAVPACDALSLSYGRTFKNLVVQAWAGPELEYSSASVSSEFENECVKPPGQPQFKAKNNLGPHGDPALELAESGAIKGIAAGFADVRVDHGSLHSERTITVVDRQDCERLRVAYYSPHRLKIGETAKLNVDYDPKDCTPAKPPKVTLTSADAHILTLQSDGSVIGASAGSEQVSIAPDASVPDQTAIRDAVSVIPDCEEIELGYMPEAIRPKPSISFEARPKLTYKPEGCTQPKGKPSYFAISGNFRVDPEGGTVTVRSVAESRTDDHVKVTVTHGSISGEGEVKLGK